MEISCPNHGKKYLKESSTKEYIYYKCTKCSYLLRIGNNENGDEKDVNI